jgi:Flp pilus assembly protein TadG
MTGRRSLRAFVGQGHATAAIEFAIVIPVLLSLMSGMVEFGRIFEVYAATNRLATRYAIAWADCSDYPTGTCLTELAMYTPVPAMQNIAPQLTNTVTLRMLEVSMSGSTATVIYATPTGATLTAAELATAQSVIASGQTGVVVTVSYVHTLIFFQQLMSPFLGTSRTITSTVAQLKS